MKHSLTLQFGRILTEGEWRDVADKARALPHVQSMTANAMQDGVAYMPVPRCETCGHWQAVDLTIRTDVVSATPVFECFVVYAGSGRGIFTDKDFGCVRWKEKP